MAIILVASIAAASEDREMTRLTMVQVPAASAAAAHRVVFAQGSDRLFMGTAETDPPMLRITEVDTATGAVASAAEVPLLLPALTEFDLLKDDDGLLLAYEWEQGGTSVIRLVALAGLQRPAPPAVPSYVDQRRPRFVRGAGATALVIVEDWERATGYELGSSSATTLCRCMDAVVTRVGSTLALAARTMRPGPMLGGAAPGELDLRWPWDGSGRRLFGGANVFDYDLVVAGDRLLVAAVLEEGPALAILTAEGREQRLAVEGLPRDYEVRSPTLRAAEGRITLAFLASPPSSVPMPVLLMLGETRLP